MLRIVGVQRSETVREEFILLQNHSSLRVSLRGHVLLGEAYLERRNASAIYAFADDELISPGGYAVVYTGTGIPRWCKSRDGSLVYHTFIGSGESVWQRAPGAIHVLSPHHSFGERPVVMADTVMLK